MSIHKSIYFTLVALLSCNIVFAQFPDASDDTIIELPEELIYPVPDSLMLDSLALPMDTIIWESVTDSLLSTVTDVDTLVNFQPLPRQFFLPAVFVSYNVDQDTVIFKPDYNSDAAFRWLEDALALDARQKALLQRVALTNTYAIKYNIGMLPEAPKKYDVIINPDDYTVAIVEQKPELNAPSTISVEELKRKYWIHAFTGNVQFSQAYVSPNWYQGGNNNLNVLIDLNHNIKLNQKFHPNLLFETNFQYKLGLYSTPDDSLRNYNISQDLLQINSTFGVKAFDKWYYTVNGQFKTQLFHSYTSNTRNLRSAFLAPGELNIGLGMTYNTSNKDKTFTLDASISPLSYNLMICRDDRLNKASYGIDPDKTTSSKYGSSLEGKLGLKITKNIKLSSRLFAFTDYKRAYSDLENTIVFEINKYLTTQIFVHLRYDTSTVSPDPDWHKLQVKEILSMGFTYKLGTI